MAEPMDPIMRALVIAHAAGRGVRTSVAANVDDARDLLDTDGAPCAEAIEALAPLATGVRADVLDWSRMTPGEAWEHARAMPRIAGPWVRWLESDRQRLDHLGRQIASVLRQPYGADVETPHTKERTRSTTMDSGMAVADAALRAAGYILVDDAKGRA